MTARDATRADREFEQAVERLLTGEPLETHGDQEPDVATAAVVARALAPGRAVMEGARGRVWHRLAPALQQAPRFGWRAWLGQALVEHRRAGVTAVAMSLLIGVGLLSPLGQQAVASAQEGFKFTLVRLTPAG